RAPQPCWMRRRPGRSVRAGCRTCGWFPPPRRMPRRSSMPRAPVWCWPATACWPAACPSGRRFPPDLLPPERQNAMTTALLRLESLDDLRRRASGAFGVWLWLHLPLILAVAWFNGTGLLASGIGALIIAAIATWFCRRDAAGAATRQVVAAAFVGMASLVVFAARGPWQIDLHMYYFAIFAVLAAYCDWRAILTAAALTALHHLVLNFALPYAIFPDGSHFGRVIVHAVIVVGECAVLIWLCLVLENLFARSAQSLSDMQVSMADRERLEADAAAERERFAAERAAQEARFEQAIGHVVAAAADGDLGQRVATGELSGVMQRVGMTVNTLLERTETVIGAAQDVTAAMAKGDLRRRVATGF